MGVICRISEEKKRKSKGKNKDGNQNKTETKGQTEDIISAEEFNQITNGLVAENNDLIKKNGNLEKEIASLKKQNEELNNKLNNMQNINCDDKIIGGNPNNESYQNNNIINKNLIKFVLLDGNEIFVTKNFLTNTSEVLKALRAQKPDLPDINHLLFTANGQNVTNFFIKEHEISSLDSKFSILLTIH